MKHYEEPSFNVNVIAEDVILSSTGGQTSVFGDDNTIDDLWGGI